MTDPSTDRDRLVGHAYKTSAPFLARRVSTATNAIRSTSGAGSSTGRVGSRRRACSTSGAVPVAISRRSARSNRRPARSGWICRPAWLPRHPPSHRRWSATRRRSRSRADAFDVVLAAHMLYHVPDVDAALASSRACCVPTGRSRRSERPRAPARDAHARSAGAPRRRARVRGAEPAGAELGTPFDRDGRTGPDEVLHACSRASVCNVCSRYRMRSRSSRTSTACARSLRRSCQPTSPGRCCWSACERRSMRRSPPRASGPTRATPAASCAGRIGHERRLAVRLKLSGARSTRGWGATRRGRARSPRDPWPVRRRGGA